jgi:seryl-tRNA synthetase
MNITEIKAKAQALGVKIGKLRKGDLIRSIQSTEGNFPCFETARDYCSQKACCWREACLPSSKTIKEWEKKKKVAIKKLTSELDDLKKQISVLEKKAKKMVGEGRKEILADINKLEKKMAAVKQKGNKLATAGEEAWKIVRKGIADALD